MTSKLTISEQAKRRLELILLFLENRVQHIKIISHLNPSASISNRRSFHYDERDTFKPLKMNDEAYELFLLLNAKHQFRAVERSICNQGALMENVINESLQEGILGNRETKDLHKKSRLRISTIWNHLPVKKNTGYVV